jgi:hypothetical protein
MKANLRKTTIMRSYRDRDYQRRINAESSSKEREDPDWVGRTL